MATTMAQHAVMHDFSNKVDVIVEEQYGFYDGGDLCYNLIESGTIDMAQGENNAARVVAQHIEQA
jgi:hypothetical protein